jgi:hypothetical protein
MKTRSTVLAVVTCGRTDIYRISVRHSFAALRCDVPAEVVTCVYREELLNLKLWLLYIII